MWLVYPSSWLFVFVLSSRKRLSFFVLWYFSSGWHQGHIRRDRQGIVYTDGQTGGFTRELPARTQSSAIFYHHDPSQIQAGKMTVNYSRLSLFFYGPSNPPRAFLNQTFHQTFLCSKFSVVKKVSHLKYWYSCFGLLLVYWNFQTPGLPIFPKWYKTFFYSFLLQL